MDTILLDFEGELAWLTLHRPDRRNAINAAMIEELLAALDTCQRQGVRALLLTGAGSSFCSGMDLEMLRGLEAQSPDGHLAESRRMAHLFQRLYAFPAPTIAAVNGPAVAGGCGLATLCDFTIAVETAKFGYPEVRIGFLPALVSVYLVRQIGEKRARDLLLTGRLIDAAEAAQWGLITRLAAAGQLHEQARELALTLLKNSPASLAGCKRMLATLPLPTVEDALEYAARENAATRQTGDFHEGVTAFLEKRAPRWMPPKA
jgi:methylglutaconyl-CoA hydratase